MCVPRQAFEPLKIITNFNCVLKSVAGGNRRRRSEEVLCVLYTHTHTHTFTHIYTSIYNNKLPYGKILFNTQDFLLIILLSIYLMACWQKNWQIGMSFLPFFPFFPSLPFCLLFEEGLTCIITGWLVT